MTEFLKGYAAGANDMEAGRLVTTSKPWAARKEVHYFDADNNRIGGDRVVLGPALTAEEAKVLLPCCDWIEDDERMLPEDEPLRGAVAKLSLIANGENDG